MCHMLILGFLITSLMQIYKGSDICTYRSIRDRDSALNKRLLICLKVILRVFIGLN